MSKRNCLHTFRREISIMGLTENARLGRASAQEFCRENGLPDPLEVISEAVDWAPSPRSTTASTRAAAEFFLWLARELGLPGLPRRASGG